MSDLAKLAGVISDARKAVAKGNTMQVGALIERALKQAVALRQAEKRGAPADPATEGAISRKLTTTFKAYVTEIRRLAHEVGITEFTLESSVAKIALRGSTWGPAFSEISRQLSEGHAAKNAVRLTLTIEPVE